MDDSVEQQLSQALLEKLEPLINTVESQLRDLAVTHDSGTPTQTTAVTTGTGLVTGRVSIQSTQNQGPSPSSARLPFPLPAKPAFPIVSTMRSSASPPPLLAGKISDRDIVASPSSATVVPTQSFDNTGQLQERVDRFPQVSSLQDDASITAASSSEVEVVRLRRKKKPASKSSTSSIASISTTTSAKRGQGAKNAKSVLGE
ncbi:hypothetical protein BGZ80_010006 [Entomortierella chlamydospora]|uniref:Uncharacterized protein n=1 Tax=Entomortierella chlamydospora TaxID=101097 RepID=A0A9P6MWA2_9FUNG|nr:hypothetical protein BGZ80_010006 [Entomortierella chlamydospora]